MDRHELARELAQPGARELLQSAPLARLAYDGPDGFPRVIPCGFYWNGVEIVVCTATTAPKVSALAARPKVAVTIDDADAGTSAGAQSVLVRGTARLDTVDGVPDEYLEAADKTMQGSDRAEFERAVRATYVAMVRISITPEWARFFDFGAGRLPGFLQDLVSDH
jgi:nitroimidazol reductase NimA-like FMN-containing flavoprotein (pyridoxamine 5'-phosphate oxidase superfamily)